MDQGAAPASAAPAVEGSATAAAALTREQQREARRQKVLARSRTGSSSPVVDLAALPQGRAGVPADLDPDVPALVDDDGGQAGVAGEDSSGKSGARLAAERRRQRILSKSNERMAKVQGDRMSGKGADAAADAAPVGEGGNLDEVMSTSITFSKTDCRGGRGLLYCTVCTVLVLASRGFLELYSASQSVEEVGQRSSHGTCLRCCTAILTNNRKQHG